ncbi:hypothetical protein CC1G_09852 [Coprinopsis cinerea okayama7|uniref:Uncharacterized protein n=1 Tax=Coprinopsis cinerea (strain Okayama-7 / 130 / ATCC MYA-4618 / FGSC 9003) TaxID=240176 RepID=A8P0E3_COPC7|nr:hypothetical protein CC1G_09852 [Coprinopsis cinerea okayama7\|eukprot:XP_001837870.2 hypothetical protein CC1G_09852 [Coprinopsis cinerea okayama7\
MSICATECLYKVPTMSLLACFCHTPAVNGPGDIVYFPLAPRTISAQRSASGNQMTASQLVAPLEFASSRCAIRGEHAYQLVLPVSGIVGRDSTCATSDGGSSSRLRVLWECGGEMLIRQRGDEDVICIYSLVVFLETPNSERKGRGPYIVMSFVILVISAIPVALDSSLLFRQLREATSGRRFITILGQDISSWEVTVSTSLLPAYILVADGLLVGGLQFHSDA